MAVEVKDTITGVEGAVVIVSNEAGPQVMLLTQDEAEEVITALQCHKWHKGAQKWMAEGE